MDAEALSEEFERATSPAHPPRLHTPSALGKHLAGNHAQLRSRASGEWPRVESEKPSSPVVHVNHSANGIPQTHNGNGNPGHGGVGAGHLRAKPLEEFVYDDDTEHFRTGFTALPRNGPDRREPNHRGAWNGTHAWHSENPNHHPFASADGAEIYADYPHARHPLPRYEPPHMWRGGVGGGWRGRPNRVMSATARRSPSGLSARYRSSGQEDREDLRDHTARSGTVTVVQNHVMAEHMVERVAYTERPVDGVRARGDSDSSGNDVANGTGQGATTASNKIEGSHSQRMEKIEARPMSATAATRDGEARRMSDFAPGRQGLAQQIGARGEGHNRPSSAMRDRQGAASSVTEKSRVATSAAGDSDVRLDVSASPTTLQDL